MRIPNARQRPAMHVMLQCDDPIPRCVPLAKAEILEERCASAGIRNPVAVAQKQPPPEGVGTTLTTHRHGTWCAT